MPRPELAPALTAARMMKLTIPSRIPSMKAPANRRQNPARGPDAFPVA
jgi:hypothetical protein